jgi:MFS family permease
LFERRILYVTALLRAFTTSLVGVSMGLFLAREGMSAAELGTVVSSGLFGASMAALVATLFGDRIGRRRLLVVLSGLSALGTLAFGLGSELPWFAGAAFLGMLNGMGRDRGAALILEQAALPGTTTAAGRTQAIAWYTVLQDVGHATGALVATLPALLRVSAEHGAAAHRGILAGCALLALVGLALYARLGASVEAPARSTRASLTPASRTILTKISALFALDALAGGFLTTALLSYFFFERFGAGEGEIGTLFFAARLMNAVSHLGAARLARRFGLVNTMVFTHIPSSLLLATVAFAPSFPVAAVLFLLREGLVEMDVPTRQSYVLAVVQPEERTFASGVTNLVRLGAWAVAPMVAGTLMVGDALYRPLVIGAALKIAYDLLLWRAFRAVRPPEEQSAPSGT